MANYILLRNNKESGPFSLEQLTEMGLKAYDLIWIENRSAGWRYPSEIAELKPIAPVVEEQPYDRFYKKSSEQTEVVSSAVESNEKNVISKQAIGNEQLATDKIQGITYAAEPVTSIQQQETINHRPQTTNKIFVTLPQNSSAKPVTKPVEQKKPVIEEKPQQVLKETSVELEEKFSQPLDEIKKQYINTVLNKKKNIRPQFVINEKIKLAALALLLLLSGTAVGLFLNRDKSSTEKLAVTNIPEQKVINTASRTEEPIIESPRQKQSETITEPEKPITLQHGKAEDEFIEDKKNYPERKKAETKEIKNEVPAQNPSIKFTRRSSKEDGQINSTAGVFTKADNQSTEPTTINKKQETINKPDLSRQISITASNYKKATFGGISNLEFTVINTSGYTIDMVAAEVEYYTANKKLYKTETVYFSNVPPNGSQVQKAPDSNRGYEVKYRISLISSKELGLYTAVR